jgi:hypothetical protein
MKLRFALAAGLFALTAMPMGADAQGLIGGAREGAHEGDRAAGPLGAVVGGAVGAGVGTVNGALGIHRGRRCYYRYGHRRCRW